MTSSIQLYFWVVFIMQYLMQSPLCNIRLVFLILALPSSSTFTRLSIANNRLQSQNKSPGLNPFLDFREQLWLLALPGLSHQALGACSASQDLLRRIAQQPVCELGLSLHADADQDTHCFVDLAAELKYGSLQQVAG